MLILLVSPRIEWLTFVQSVIARADKNILVRCVICQAADGKLFREQFQANLAAISYEIEGILTSTNLDRQVLVGGFDLAGFRSSEGTLSALDYVGGGNLFASLVLRFPLVDWHLCHPSMAFLGDNPGFPPAAIIASADIAADVLVDRIRIPRSPEFDGTGLRSHLKAIVFGKVFAQAMGTGQASRSGDCVILDDERHRCRLLGLCAYIAGFRAEPVWNPSMFDRLLVQRNKTDKIDLVIEPVVLSIGDDPSSGYQLGISARRDRAPMLREASGVFVYSADATSAIPEYQVRIVRRTPPTSSVWALVSDIQAACPANWFAWPPSQERAPASAGSHMLPRQVQQIARDLIAWSKAIRETAPIASALLACEALELTYCRGPLAVEATIEKHSAILYLEMQNVAEFDGSDPKERMARTTIDLVAVSRSIAYGAPTHHLTLGALQERAFAAQVDLYRERYHFREEMVLLRGIRAATTPEWSPVHLINFFTGGVSRFCLSVLVSISAFTLVDIWWGHCANRPISFHDIWIMFWYSAVGFASVQPGPSQWLSYAGVTVDPSWGWLLFVQTVVAALHWGVGLALAVQWLARR